MAPEVQLRMSIGEARALRTVLSGFQELNGHVVADMIEADFEARKIVGRLAFREDILELARIITEVDARLIGILEG